jgi:hypothetical protein
MSPSSTHPPPRPNWYFFYGSLTDSNVLAELLHLSSPPVLQPARIQTHTLKYFGPNPCAVPGTLCDTDLGPKNETRDGVEGKAWYVHSAEMADWLRRHEDEGFVEVGCEIEFLGGGVRPPGSEVSEAGVIGRMFEWRGSGQRLLDAPSM